MGEHWRTTVADLLELFRRGLRAMVPVAQDARIPWRAGEAYDQWDAIAGCLYQQIVVDAVRHAEEVAPGLVLPPYDMLCPRYEDAFIEVRSPSIPATALAAFIAFSGKSAEFEVVRCAGVLPSGEVARERADHEIPYEECRFALRMPDGRRLEALTIPS